MNVIVTEQLTRDFRDRRAVDGISFTVEEGEIFGFLGPNGAGKTTTIRMLTGQLSPTAGEARVAGCDVRTEQGRLMTQIGVVFEYQNLYERMNARDNLAFYAGLYGANHNCVEQALEQVQLSDRAKEPIKRFSNGMKQRLLIARSLLHGPRVLFLDEPTRGLDPAVSQEIRSLIRKLAGKGVTVFLTTHYMEEADQLCSRVAFLNSGRIVALDTPARLKVAYGQHTARVNLQDGRTLNLALDQPKEAAQLGELLAAGKVQTLHSNEATLEEVFIQLTGRSLIS
jgi:ABC-2 type transport system ATP-binding protein